ncbi:MAG: YwaF family protein [Bacilli bacterium]|nr:YwaF family protein [Bacilli bacterium]HHU23521.1 YwaF family protein [Acholeplasmataceae bacterium]
MTIRAFNGVFWILNALIVIGVIVIAKLFRDKSLTVRKKVMIWLCSILILIFFLYKIALSLDAEFLVINRIEKFDWWSELPLQLCNINMFLIMLSVIFDKKAIMGFAFFVAPLGAFMAITFPEPAFTDSNIFLLRNLGFYLTHGLIMVAGISLCTLGFFRPKLKIVPKVMLILTFLALIMHGLNIVLRSTVSPIANYFYTFPPDISILQLFYSWLPVPFLYEIFGIVILGVYALIVTIPFMVLEKRNIPESKKELAGI